MSAVSVSESGMRPILADAVDLARRALLELEPVAVGAYLGVIAEDESSATHRFEATLPGYRGWQWAVVVAAPPGADYATVSESALLPGPDALVAPEFVPWEQRVRPGDLAPGDLLAPPVGDPRLVPGYVATGDPVVDEVAYEVGLGRTKVMSKEGREEAAGRWYAEYGPDSEMAKAAPATCGTCGFYLPLAGSLRAAFGVCGNAMGADGRVVHTGYGCGAHSDTEVPSGSGSPLYEAYDDAAIEMISLEPERAESASRVSEQDSTEPAEAGGEHPVEVVGDGSVAAAEQAEDASRAAVAESVGVVGGDAATERDTVAEPAAADVSELDVLADAVAGESEDDGGDSAAVLGEASAAPEEHGAEPEAEAAAADVLQLDVLADAVTGAEDGGSDSAEAVAESSAAPENGSESTAVDGPISAADHTAVPGEPAGDESGVVTIDTGSVGETADEEPGTTVSSHPAAGGESGPASFAGNSAGTESATAPAGEAVESSADPSQTSVEPAATAPEWPAIESDSVQPSTTSPNDVVSSAVESDSPRADPAESAAAGTEAVQSVVEARSEPASGSESGATETPIGEPTGIEESGAQADSGIDEAGGSEARPEFPSSPRS
ncbi:DUF3027 domain-containing protein [Nocardia amamiensis]|uniref:DUF3027 domain-containing protein n=1 Tax=Nocardia amamiensis TaxID=404578 RepID=UPI003F7D7C2B